MEITVFLVDLRKVSEEIYSLMMFMSKIINLLKPTKEKLYGVIVVFFINIVSKRVFAPLLDELAKFVRFRLSYDHLIVNLILLYLAVCLIVNYTDKRHGLVSKISLKPTKEKLYGVIVVFLFEAPVLWAVLAFLDEVMHFDLTGFRILIVNLILLCLVYLAVCLIVNYTDKRHGLVAN